MSRLAVCYRPEASAEEIAHLEAKLGLAAVRRIAPLRITAYEEREGLAEALAEESIVEYVEREETFSTR